MDLVKNGPEVAEVVEAEAAHWADLDCQYGRWDAQQSCELREADRPSQAGEVSFDWRTQ